METGSSTIFPTTGLHFILFGSTAGFYHGSTGPGVRGSWLYRPAKGIVLHGLLWLWHYPTDTRPRSVAIVFFALESDIQDGKTNSGKIIMWKKCEKKCCTMEYTAGEYGSQTCAANKDGKIKSSQRDLRTAWEQDRCVICGHQLIVSSK